MAETTHARARFAWISALLLLGFLWASQSTGLVSSNDGSHLALARALALRGETTIDPEMALTLRVDLAKRGEHYYSDRPPGTAMMAIPSAWLGAQLDPGLWDLGRERGELVVAPACPRYIHTYAARVRGAPPLAGLMGTALVFALHTVLVGLWGLWCVDRLLRRRDVSQAARWFAMGALGLGTLWGPYSTTLFGHSSAAVWMASYLLAVDHLGAGEASSGTSPQSGSGSLGRVAFVAGLCGGWAIACDYLLVAAVLPLALICVKRQYWVPVLAGGLAVGSLVGAYHQAAFGSPFSLGYHHHTNFEFARTAVSTFDGNLLLGAWTLLGFGHGGAGLLAQAPIAAFGIAGWWVASPPDRRRIACFGPWLLLLCMHRTPFGGATEDHRYLVPALATVGLGMGFAWDRWCQGKAMRVAVLALAVASTWLVWSHFLESHDVAPFVGLRVGILVALALGSLLAIVQLGRRLWRKSP